LLALLLLCRFVVVGFCLLGLASYAVFLTGRVGTLEARLHTVSLQRSLTPTAGLAGMLASPARPLPAAGCT
jgi:hypothetical protein